MTNSVLANHQQANSIIQPQGVAGTLEAAVAAFCGALIGRNRAELTIKAYLEAEERHAPHRMREARTRGRGTAGPPAPPA